MIVGRWILKSTWQERFWGWFGSVTHWLYPTLLRQNGPLWSQVVIWSAIVGTFLTAFGIYIGISQFKRRRSGDWSPYKGIAWWHHYLGLIFGLLTLTWLVSGLFSMNPWGLLQGGSARAESVRIRDYTITWADTRSWIEGLEEQEFSTDLTRIESAPLSGRPAAKGT